MYQLLWTQAKRKLVYEWLPVEAQPAWVILFLNLEYKQVGKTASHYISISWVLTMFQALTHVISSKYHISSMSYKPALQTDQSLLSFV